MAEEDEATEEATGSEPDADDTDMAAAMLETEPQPAADDATVGGELFGDESRALEAYYDVSVDVTAILGTSTMPISQILKLGRGAVVELDRKVGEPIDIEVNGRLVARGEVVVIDERLGVTMTEIIKLQ